MTILDEINNVKKEEVKNLRQNYSLTRFADSEFFTKLRLSFLSNIDRNERISIIAEIKKASPSKGIIIENFNHLDIANIYMENEVDAISVLTDSIYFQGSISFMNDIAKIKSIPILRKDFIIDEYQIFETKSNGADAVLLIAESLSANQISELTSAAFENDMEVLLELHSADQIEKINFKQNKIIGINNRDLKNFNVDLNTTNIIAEFIPDGNIIVSESGIKSKSDIEFIRQTRSSAILVGESLMSSKDIGKAVKDLKSGVELKVKICGITNIQDALFINNLGADAIGFILYPMSKRYVEPEKVKEIITHLPPFLTKVGVFVNEGFEKVNKIAKYTGINIVQLHGEESPDYLSQINYPVMKAFRIDDSFDFNKLNNYSNASFLLDSFHIEKYGGTGTKFDWSIIPEELRKKIILAGGVSEDNIEYIYEYISPYAVDISSSVEVSPGIKDQQKLIKLFEKIRVLGRDKC